MTDSTIPSAQPAIAEDLFCQKCGYNLRGLTGDRCPECGESLAGVRSQVSQIPWVHRKELGWWRAYWKTVRLVLRHPHRLADEIARPVDYGYAQRFRWVTCVLAGLPVVLSGIWFVISASPRSDSRFNIFWVHGGMAATWHVCYLAYLGAATGIASYFFHPRAISVRQQNRAIALTYYACAPLAFIVVGVANAFLAIIYPGSDLEYLWWLTAIVVAVGLMGVWWWQLVHLMRRLLPGAPFRIAAVAISVPVLWFALGWLFLVAVPVAFVYVFLIFSSMLR